MCGNWKFDWSFGSLLWVALNFSATLELIDRENYIVINRNIYFISNLIESKHFLDREKIIR